MTTVETPSDVSDDSDTSEPEGAAAPGVFIQHGLRNEAIISRPIQGQVTQVGRENIISICTETKTFQIKISSKQKDVEAVVAINMIPDQDLDPTKTLVLGQETTQREITTGEEIIFRIECDERRTRPRNGYISGCDLRSETRRILRSLFDGVNMIVNYFHRGSIIIGLEPKTDRAVFTLLKAMEGGFIEELVRGILENEPDWNIEDDSGDPIKMKIDINIPQGVFPKDFPCKKFASRKELLQELQVSLEIKEKEETVEKELDRPKSSAPKMSLDESRTLMSEMAKEMYQEMLTRRDDDKDIKETMELEDILKLKDLDNYRMENSKRISREEREIHERELEYGRMKTKLDEEKRAYDEMMRARARARRKGASAIYASKKRNALFGGEKKTAGIAKREESKDRPKSSASKMSLDESRTLMSEMDEEMSTRKDDVTEINETTEGNTEPTLREDREIHELESEYRRMKTDLDEELRDFEEKGRLIRVRRKPERMGASGIYTSDISDVLMGTVDIAPSEESKDRPKSSAFKMILDESKTLMSEMDEEMSTRKDDLLEINETTEEKAKRISQEECEIHERESELERIRMDYYAEMRALREKILLMEAREKEEKAVAAGVSTSGKKDDPMSGEKKTAGIAHSEESKAMEKKIRLMRAGGVAGAAAVGAVVAGPVGAVIGGFVSGTYWVISDLWSSYSRKNTQN